ncbi:MAG: hypothetical protein IKQ39_03530 [Oscillospiraceae bacterium]|nr:hypothetical protein [Oscillospiraceae bacterium]
MHRLIRTLLTLCTLLLTALLLSGTCFAETELPPELSDTLSQADEMVPEAAREALSESEISFQEPESVLELSPSDYLHRFLRTLKQEAAAPLTLLGALLSLTLLSSLLSGLSDTVTESGMRRLVGTLCVLICTAGAARPLCGCLRRTAEALQTGQLFMLSFVPVFSAFLAAGGHAASGAAYQVFILFLSETVMQLTNALLFPLLQTAAAIGIVDAVNPELRLGGFVSGFRTAVTWTLTSLMTLFSALLSVRSFVAASADSLAAKSVKLLSSSLIPIVGSAVSDAYGTVQGSLRLVRNGAGAIGILVLLALILPPLLSLLLYRAVFAAARIFADAAGTDALSALFKHIQSVLAAAFAMLICFAVMLIFSCAILLLLTNGA